MTPEGTGMTPETKPFSNQKPGVAPAKDD